MPDLLTDKRQINAPEIVYVPPIKYLDPTSHHMEVLEEWKEVKHQSLTEGEKSKKKKKFFIKPTNYFFFPFSRPHLSPPFSKYFPSYY